MLKLFLCVFKLVCNCFPKAGDMSFWALTVEFICVVYKLFTVNKTWGQRMIRKGRCHEWEVPWGWVTRLERGVELCPRKWINCSYNCRLTSIFHPKMIIKLKRKFPRKTHQYPSKHGDWLDTGLLLPMELGLGWVFLFVCLVGCCCFLACPGTLVDLKLTEIRLPLPPEC